MKTFGVYFLDPTAPGYQPNNHFSGLCLFFNNLAKFVGDIFVHTGVSVGLLQFMHKPTTLLYTVFYQRHEPTCDC